MITTTTTSTKNGRREAEKCESSHGGIRPRRRVGIWRTVAVCTPRASISRRRHSHGGYFVFLVPGEVGQEQAEEVLKALKCAIMNAKLFGADAAERIWLDMAGSHLCAIALLDEEETQKKESEKLKSFIGMCGVYNIETHYEYEDKRGVAMLSTMGRAMGGREKFKEMSPFHILEDRSSSSSNNKSGSSDSGGEDNNDDDVTKSSFPKTYLFTSDTDIVVPKRESEDLHRLCLKLV